MASPEWLWAIKQTHERHSDRMSFMRPISYAMIRTEIWRTNQDGNGTAGHALSLNISSKGLLILMDRRPAADRALQQACIEDGMSKWKAWLVYQAVRLFGNPAADPANERPLLYAP